MLLYALACRHGWGMRPNPAEAVTWLQKAVDSAQLEVAEDETTASQGKPSDAMDRAAHKAQFALGVYELGMSYMKGWGVQQDRALGLRCFEVAGTWGDTDALLEAGLCYTEGIGCKKDKVKAARYYRIAEAKGTSLAGNSWYVYIFFSISEPLI
jgi:TPR repeat protein